MSAFPEVPSSKTVGIVAHRSLRLRAEENSREAFEDLVTAYNAGIPLGVEFDIRRTGDGVMVLCHDPDFRGVDLVSVSYDELFLRFGVECPPLLKDIIAILAKAPGMAITPELKETGYTAEALALICQLPVESLLVSSFLPEVVREIRLIAPQLKTGLLIEDYEGNSDDVALFLTMLEESGADALIPHHSQISDRLRSCLNTLGKQLGTYTVNEPQLLRWMYDTNIVDWICTDVPEVLAPDLHMVFAEKVPLEETTA